MRIVIESLKVAAGKIGLSVHRHSPAAQQRNVLALLKPVQTEHRLIRLGGDTDGGYLLPDDLEGIGACFSPGVDVVATFERDVVERGIPTFQIDASVEDTPLKHELNDFEAKFLGIETRDNLITLDDWVKAKVTEATGDLLLQMDIEGHEWLTFAAISTETLLRFRIMVLELHFVDGLTHGLGPWLFQPVLERLARYFDVVHLHANNVTPLVQSRELQMSRCLEVTFYRKDRSVQRSPLQEYPNILDRDNVPNRPSVHMPLELFAR